AVAALKVTAIHDRVTSLPRANSTADSAWMRRAISGVDSLTESFTAAMRSCPVVGYDSTVTVAATTSSLRDSSASQAPHSAVMSLRSATVSGSWPREAASNRTVY